MRFPVVPALTSLRVPLLFSLFFPVHVRGGSNNFGDPCSQGDSRLQVGTYQFWSDCNSQTFCAANSTCAHKGCRRDEFPFGYATGHGEVLPPKCDRGSFCPDEQDRCVAWLAVGSACQLNRDDQCEGPPNYRELADQSDFGLNVNGSVCLNNVCMWANVTQGETCVVENTAYTAYAANDEFIDIVSRGNCRVGLYCDSQQLKCIQTRETGASCDADKECSTYNCLSSGICGVSLETPHHFGAWVYVLVCISIFGGMFGTLFGLYYIHRSQRDQEREKRMQYWREQNAFHQSLAQMRESARNSIMSMGTVTGNGGNSARSTMYGEEVNQPASQAAPKASGLRHADESLERDGSSESHSRHQHHGRF